MYKISWLLWEGDVDGSVFIRRKELSARYTAVVFALVLGFSVVAVRLFALCILQHDKYQSMADDNVFSETALKAERGTIYDRNMNVMATSHTEWRIFLSPVDIRTEEDAARIAEGIVMALGEDVVSYDKVYESAKMKTSRDRTVLKSATAEQKDAVLRFALTYGYAHAVRTEATVARSYPYGDLASHVIGFAGTDNGLLGLEAYYDGYLKGVDGNYLSSKDAAGGRLPDAADLFIPATDGASLITTVDVTLQRLLENQLEKTYNDSQARNRVTGIVMDPRNGAVLAMATYPDFDLNDPFTLDSESLEKLTELGYVKGSDEYRAAYNNALYSMWNNKAVSVLYEPGSTFKIVTTSVALETGASNIGERFFCNGALKISGYGTPIRCHKRTGHGSVTFAEALQQSCNPSMMTLAARIGGSRFMDYFISLGFTDKTGIDLPGEAGGIFHSREDFNTVELAVYSFGQTFKITPLRQLTSICAIANGGVAVTPHLVSKIIDADGEILWGFTEENGERVLSETACRTISGILEEGVSGDGGAKNAGVAGYSIAAKTGTSQKRDIRDRNVYVGSCVAYAPALDPQIAVIIAVDEPDCPIYYGSAVAAPYVSAFLEQALPYLGISPEYTEAEERERAVNIGNYRGITVSYAKRELEKLGVDYEVIGGGDTVIGQIPAEGETVVKSLGRVLLFTEEAESETARVPDLVGRTATEAINTLVGLGFNIQLAGVSDYSRGVGATVIAQTPISEELPRGTVVTLTLRYLDNKD